MPLDCMAVFIRHAFHMWSGLEGFVLGWRIITEATKRANTNFPHLPKSMQQYYNLYLQTIVTVYHCNQ